jgi:hypothetical protein
MKQREGKKSKPKSSGRGKFQTEKNDHHLSYPLTYKDVVELLKIIDATDRGELHLELEDFKLSLVKE